MWLPLDRIGSTKKIEYTHNTLNRALDITTILGEYIRVIAVRVPMQQQTQGYTDYTNHVTSTLRFGPYRKHETTSKTIEQEG